MEDVRPVLVPFMGFIATCETLEDANWLLNYNTESIETQSQEGEQK